ncbi:uncharacterized protein OsI_027940 isoform X2 [Gastrolobium bilobum]|uniref:uncharacterized protein OsI_027940 isoform X2 n=1 Tax=Gastrolobium bilobum TaxID=150636 RepID=UPI002AB20952|nr:uncharacterized protein OsI_027940 isoform X2 [Gastrolobium bilobum]
MSRHPEVKWAQRVDKVYITVQLADSKNAKVDLTPDGVFTFSGSAGAEDHQYELKLELFDKVNVEESKINVGVRSIFCVVQKAESGWWKRLLRGEGKPPHYVKVDWDKWVDEDEDDVIGEPDMGGMDFSKFGGMGDDAMDDIDENESDDEEQEVSNPGEQDAGKSVGEASTEKEAASST